MGVTGRLSRPLARRPRACDDAPRRSHPILFLHDRQQALRPEQDLAAKAEEADPDERRNVDARHRRDQRARRLEQRLRRDGGDRPRQLLEVILGKPREHDAHEEEDGAHGEQRAEHELGRRDPRHVARARRLDERQRGQCRHGERAARR
eukprot:3452970-Prymnesium_polylepis.1